MIQTLNHHDRGGFTLSPSLSTYPHRLNLHMDGGASIPPELFHGMCEYFTSKGRSPR